MIAPFLGDIFHSGQDGESRCESEVIACIAFSGNKKTKRSLLSSPGKQPADVSKHPGMCEVISQLPGSDSASASVICTLRKNYSL